MLFIFWWKTTAFVSTTTPSLSFSPTSFQSRHSSTPLLSFSPTRIRSTRSYHQVRLTSAFVLTPTFNLSETTTSDRLQRSLSSCIHKSPCSTRKDRGHRQALSLVDNWSLPATIVVVPQEKIDDDNIVVVVWTFVFPQDQNTFGVSSLYSRLQVYSNCVSSEFNRANN